MESANLRRATGESPRAEIRYGVSGCSLGFLLVAATPTGICAISLGDEPEALLRDLRDDFHSEVLVPDDDGLRELISVVVGLVDTPSAAVQLPLDIRGTAFQQKVWASLRTVPPGKTISYATLAERIGSPRGVRAVASACAANRLAVAIPCHRVVRSDGGLSGYRWGTERKRALLVGEGSVREGIAQRGKGAPAQVE